MGFDLGRGAIESMSAQDVHRLRHTVASAALDAGMSEGDVRA
jgi:hypothetical protein